MAIDPCPPPTPPTRGVVRFVAAEFRAVYSAFAAVTDQVLQNDFNTATLFLNNSCCSVVRDANQRQALLYMLTAHVAALLQGENGKPPSGFVGRISEGAEGTASASAEYAGEMSMTEAYFAQTQYGAMFWQSTVPYRSMLYVAPAPRGCFGLGSDFFPWGGR